MFYLSTLTAKVFNVLTCLILGFTLLQNHPALYDVALLWVVSLILLRLGWVTYQFMTLPDLSRENLTPERRHYLAEEIHRHVTFIGGMNVMQRITVALLLMTLLFIHHEWLLGVLSIVTFFARMLFEIEVSMDADQLEKI